MKKRILLFIKTPPPTTGATFMNLRVKESNLLQSTYDVRSICISYMDKRADMGKIKLSKIRIVFEVLVKLIIELLFHRPQVIYFQLTHKGNGFYRDLLFIVIMKLFMVKIVYHLHGKGIKVEARSWFKRIIYKFSFWNSHLVTLSKKLNYDVEDVYKGTIYSIFNGIADDESVNKMYSIESDKTINLLFLSNLVKNKGILDFVESIKILRERKLVFKAYIVGAEADINTKELNTIIADSELEQTLIYLGPKYGIEKKKILKDSDIFIFPTMNDCFPIVLLEALQFGLPVISTNEGAITDIIDNEYSGFIVDKKNPKEIADKVEYLIKNPEKLGQMSRNSRDKYLNEFTLKQFEKNLSSVFHEILQRSH